MKRLAIWLSLLLLSAPIFARAATTAVSGTKVVTGFGAPLAAGKWCFGATCLTVTNGNFSGTVTSATATVTVTNTAGSTTYLTMPSVVIGGATYNWDLFTQGMNITSSGIGIPYIACQPGGVWQQTDNGSYPWTCYNYNGQAIWSGSPIDNVGTGLYAGQGEPTFACQSPCLYTQTDASTPSNAVWTIFAQAGAVSSNWIQQTGGGGGSGITQLTGPVTAGPGSGSQATTITATGVTPGSYTNPTFTVAADGRVTAASNGGTPANTVVTNPTTSQVVQQPTGTQFGVVASGAVDGTETGFFGLPWYFYQPTQFTEPNESDGAQKIQAPVVVDSTITGRGDVSTTGAVQDLNGVFSLGGLALGNIPITTSQSITFVSGTGGGFNYLANATSGAITLTLPDATLPVATIGGTFTSFPTPSNPTAPVTQAAASTYPIGQIYVFKKTDSSANAVTITAAAGQTIDGAAAVNLTTQNQYIIIQSNGSGSASATGWSVIGSTPNPGTLTAVTARAPLECTTTGSSVNCSMAQADLAMQVVPPISGQYVVIYPTAYTAGCLVGNCAAGGYGTPMGSVSSAYLRTRGTAFAAGQTVTWSGFSLPSYVVPANVTAIYATGTSGFTGKNQFDDFSASSPGVGNVNLKPTNTNNNYAMQQVTALYTIDPTLISGASFTADTYGQSSFGCCNYGQMNVASVALIVYYTGTPPPATTAIQVVPPAFYNPSINTLGVDPNAPFPGLDLQPATVATLPDAATPPVGTIYSVMDGASATDCTTGGSTHTVLCQTNGTAWSAFSAGSSGGTVTTSGSPVSPNIAAFSSGTAITAATSANIQTAIGAGVYDASGAAAARQANLSLLPGTYTNGDMCTYASSGTLLNCNTAIPSVGSWGALNYPTWASGTPFVKMTAAGTFSLDTNTYAPLNFWSIAFNYNLGVPFWSCTATQWAQAPPSYDFSTGIVTFAAVSTLSSGSITCTDFNGNVVTQSYPTTGTTQTINIPTQFGNSGGAWTKQTSSNFISSLPTQAGAGSTDYSTASSAQVAHCLADGTGCPGGTVYNAAGTQLPSAHTVMGLTTLSAGTVTVTFSGSAIFTSSSSYACMTSATVSTINLDALGVTYTSGSSVTFSDDGGLGSDAIRYICIGN